MGDDDPIATMVWTNAVALDGGRDDSYSGEYDDDDADCYREAVWSCFPGPGCTLVGFETVCY
ncbi:MAG: hypothetical protein R3A47_05860 [Polyangiales bacterium]